MKTLAANQLSLAPLGAGDLIDRAVRLYRRHFMTLIRIAAPPVVVSAIGSVLWTIGWRSISVTSNEARLPLYGALLAVGGALLVGGNLLSMIVMGGATRNLVTHLLWNEPVSARATYRAVRTRFFGLLGATVLVGGFIIFASSVTIFAWFTVLMFVVAGVGFFAQVAPVWVTAAVGAISTFIVTLGALWLFFLLVGRFAYVPQVMLVEGRGVFASLGRSSSLASGNVRRLMAMALFSTFAAYSALMLLVIPLGWYGYLNGINPFAISEANWPAWYSVSYNALAQSSSILLAPIWMLGLSLLYVDERVRHEGYDIELMAARQLGVMPQLANVTSPFAPAIVAEAAPPSSRTARAPELSSGSILGLR